jgi:hypothetical protein
MASSSPIALGSDLLGKAAGLVNGVVELGEGVGVLVAADHELEAVREARVIGLALGQRADLLGVVADERGINQRGLAQLVVELEEELASAPAVLVSMPLARQSSRRCSMGVSMSTCSPTTCDATSERGTERQVPLMSTCWPWYVMTSCPPRSRRPRAQWP